MSYRFADSSLSVCKPVWHIPLLCAQWKTPDNGQRNWPKCVEFYSKNKVEKLVHLVGFITRIYWTIFLKRAQFDLRFVGGTGYVVPTRTATFPSDNFWCSLAVTDLHLLRERMELFACRHRLPQYCTFIWNWLSPAPSLNSLFCVLHLLFNYCLPNSLRLKITSTSFFSSSLTYLFLLKSNPPLFPCTVYILDVSSSRIIFFSCFCCIYLNTIDWTMAAVPLRLKKYKSRVGRFVFVSVCLE